MIRCLTLISLIPLTLGCSADRAGDIHLRQYSDPLTGEQGVLQLHEIGPWSLYTYPGDEDAVLMVTKHGKPLVSISDLDSRIVVIHSANPAVSAATLIDEELDGDFNRIDYGSDSFFAQDSNFDGWIDSLTIDGRTLIWLDDQWLELISYETKGRTPEHFVDMATGRHRVVLKDGSWRFAPEIAE